MTSTPSKAETRRADVFARIEELQDDLGRVEKYAVAAETEAVHLERLRDEVQPVRPHANSLFAYFWPPKSLPPVPFAWVPPAIAPIRTEREQPTHGLVGPAYRSDAGSAAVRLEGLQTELDATRTRLARARRRAAIARNELARRRARAKLDDRFSLKEYAQVIALLALAIAIPVALVHG